jgi:hypothetical protein
MRGKPRDGSKGGRPRKGKNKIDPTVVPEERQVFELAKLSMSGEEIASILGLTRDRLYKDANLNTALNKGHQECNASLRRKQYQVAMRGNVTMLIWLDKQRLGGKDKSEFAGPDGGPIPLTLAAKKDALESILERVASKAPSQ